MGVMAKVRSLDDESAAVPSALPDAMEGAWTLVRGEGPVIATALHDGHQVRPEVARHFKVTDEERLREEDPRTSDWVRLAPTRLVVHRSRFEVDLNRPLEEAVYVRPDQSWGIHVWQDAPPPDVIQESRRIHQGFYDVLRTLLADIEREHGRFVLYDLHSYNYRRNGPLAPPQDGRKNPDVNLGTGSMRRERWAPVVDAFMEALSCASVLGRQLDVRENVRFKGGYLVDWVHRNFPETGCALAVEVKKFFMDEWTGEVEPSRLEAVGEALAGTVPPVVEALRSN